MTFAEWWYDYKIKNGLLAHVDRFMPHAEAAWNAALAQLPMNVTNTSRDKEK